MLKILFVCTGNTCRSPMAEALFRHEKLEARLPFDVSASSAGMSAIPGERASKPVRKLLEAEGIIDLNDHTARRIDQQLVDDADVILTMAAGHRLQLLSRYPHLKGKAFLIKEFAGIADTNGDIEDPMGLGIEKYRQVLEDIRVCIKKIMLKLREELENADRPGK